MTERYVMKTPATTIDRWILLLAILACAASFASGHAAKPVRVRVLTYNIHHGAGTDGKTDLARTAGAIKRLTPDLVALQEVDKATTRSRGVDQAAELGRLTGMHFAFGKAMDFAGGQYGEAILSRYPLMEIQVHSLPFISTMFPTVRRSRSCSRIGQTRRPSSPTQPGPPTSRG